MTADAVWCRRYCYIYHDTICKLFALLCVSIWYYDFTTNGEGEWRGRGPLKAGTGRRKPQQVRARQAQAFGSGKHATAGNGVMWRQSERRSPPLRRCTRNSRQGVQTRAEHTRLRHKDRAVKRDEIRISTSGRSVDFLTIHRPA